MSSANARIESLERSFGAGRCPACGAGGDWSGARFTLHTSGEPLPPPVPCPVCGTVPFVFTLNIGTLLRPDGSEQPR
jgi:hypothetical protein